MERRQGAHSFFTTAADGRLFRDAKKISPRPVIASPQNHLFVVSSFRSTVTITPAWGDL